jgi:Leucine-rich repeat (LRR) protein
MKNRTLMSGLLLLALGCGGDSTGPPLVLQPGDLCSGQPAPVIATFENANLELAVRFALSLGAQTDLTCGLVSGLTTLSAEQGGITSLVGIQNLTSLTILELGFNAITDISALSGLTSLTILDVGLNSLTDIDAVSALTSWRSSTPASTRSPTSAC